MTKDPLVTAQVSLERVKGDIVTNTLDTLNSSSKSKTNKSKDGVNQSYEFNKSVLDAAYDAKGILVNGKS